MVTVVVVMTSRPGHVMPPLVPVEVGCGELTVDDVWVSGFAKLMTESALRLLDVNKDGVLDVLLGFATGPQKYSQKYLRSNSKQHPPRKNGFR